METLKNKIDFVVLVTAYKANVNGDPLDGNRPRTDYDGYGEISDVCIKRKIRNRMQDLENKIFVQSDDRCDDGYGSLSERAAANLKNIKDKDDYAKTACETWLDVRSFGQVFAFKANKKGEGVSVGVRGPVSIHQAVSVSPIQIQSMQITKSVNGEPAEGKSPDTMGMKHMVNFGLYKIKGSINVQLAQKTGFSDTDANVLRECLRTLFVNDASSARPEGSMEVYKLYWWQHNCGIGQYSSAKVHRSVKISLKNKDDMPKTIDDYVISYDDSEIKDLNVEIIDGI